MGCCGSKCCDLDDSHYIPPSPSVQVSRPAPVQVPLPAQVPVPLPILQSIRQEASQAPADEPVLRPYREKVTAQEIRELRDLMRQKYALDIELWSLRYAKARDRDLILEKAKKADAAMNRIRKTVASWDEREYFYTKEEFERLKDIKKRVNQSGIRNWTREPPWTTFVPPSATAAPQYSELPVSSD